MRNRSRYSRAQRLASWLTLAVFLGAPLPAAATDTQALGGVDVSAGSGEFTLDTRETTEFTQHSQRTILDWHNDIQQPAYHSLEFRQEDGYVVLNRSPGERASNFFGRVDCDATCIFSNSAGITFHDGSYIDVGRMIAVAGTIGTSDFLNGDLHFTNLSGAVLNYGTLTGGSIDLLGRRVANFGHVSTEDGSFMMLAGDEVTIRDHDSPIVIQTRLSQPEAGSDGSRFADEPAVENAGTIDAGRGSVRLAAGDMLSFAVRQSGTIAARKIVLEGGDEGLVEVSGQLDADQDHGVGGTIHVLGDYVSIQDGAELDASGPRGGGQIWVGGGPQGQADVRNARGTFVHESAKLRADATRDGDGGEVVVWADETAQVHGEISARGGARSGSGGFSETSGKYWLDVTRAPDLRRRSGLFGDRGGHWLIDPNNIEIVASGCGSKPVCLDDGLSPENRLNPNFDQSAIRPTVDNSKITNTVIATALQQGSNVTIVTDTIAEVQGTQAGDIVVSAPIYVDDSAAQSGTEVTLALLAANDLIVNADIAVTNGASPTPASEPGFLDLDIILVAGDARQAQAPDQPGQPAPVYQGDLEINANLWSGGGYIGLGGVGVDIASNVVIDTDGGDLDLGDGSVSQATGLSLGALGGDLTLRALVDTSTSVLDDTGLAIAGGDVSVLATAVKREATSDPDSPIVLVGGNVTLDGDIRTGGGAIRTDEIAGNVTVNSKLTTSGGDVSLLAQLLEVDLNDGAANIPAGGRITLTKNAVIESGGGAVVLGNVDPTVGATAAEIVLNGRIDSRVYEDDGVTLVPDAPGGAVILSTFSPIGLDGELIGNGARVTVDGTDVTGETVVTNGGRFESRGDGRFYMEDAVIDVSTAPGTVPEDVLDSVVVIDHVGQVDIVASTPGASRISADEVIEIAPSPQRFVDAAQGISPPEFGTNDVRFAGEVWLQSDEIFLLAGDGYGGFDTNAEVVLDAVKLEGTTPGTSPTRFALLQDTDLFADDVTAQLENGLTGVQRYELAASDGVLTVDNIDGATIDEELALVLSAATDVDFVGPALQADSLGSLDIQINEGFTIEQTGLADKINGSAPRMSITTGHSNFDAPANLVLDAALAADEEVVLHAGAAGDGALSFTSSAGLTSSEVVFWAGNGDATGTATVDVSNLADGAIQDVGGTRISRFELRQDPAISDATIPDATKFALGVDGIDYTLRSEDGAITIDTPADLANTYLHLYAEQGITLGNLLTVRTMDMGGLLNFRFTQALSDKIAYTNDAESKLTLRAGLRSGDGQGGVLSFGVFSEDDPATPQVEGAIQADEIRLVAGDGVGGDGVNSVAPSIIQLITTPEELVWGQPTNDTPTFQSLSGAALDFVFQQDGAIEQNALPSFTSNFNSTAPGRYAIRSDDGGLTLSSFDQPGLPNDQLPRAEELLVLAGRTVDLLRTDGEDLDIDVDFDTGTVDGPDELQMRTWEAAFRATYLDSDLLTLDPAFLPGTTLRLGGFDGELSADPRPSPVPPELDFDTPPSVAPDSIQVVQDATIDDADLIDLSQVYGGLNTYRLASDAGSIFIEPDQVTDAALSLLLQGAEISTGTRDIVFQTTPGDEAFTLESLQAYSPFDWTIGGQSPNLVIDAEQFISLTGAAFGVGNVDFAGAVTLQAGAINVTAGNLSGSFDASETAPPPVIRTENVTFELTDPGNALVGRQLVLTQQGAWDDTTDGTVPGVSRIPDASQMVRAEDGGDPEARIDELQLWSLRGSIDMTDLTDPDLAMRLPARRVGLFAGSSETSDVHVLLERADGSNEDLDLTDFELVRFQTPSVTLHAKGTGRISAEKDTILFSSVDLDPSTGVQLAPLSLVFQQEQADFDESAMGYLPMLSQILVSGSQVDYQLVTDGDILVDNQLAIKVDGTNLVLDAAGVDIDINSPRFDDLFLQSLVVDVSRSSGEIRMRDDGRPEDALRILTLGDMTFNGDVELDGSIEAYGGTVAFNGRIDVADAALDTTHELTVLAGTGAVFEGDIGTDSGANTLENLSVRMDPSTSLTDPANVRFGSEDGGTDTRVVADRIEMWAVQAPADGQPTLRLPRTSTLYKKNGDLTFETHEFDMGLGEKMTVQGDVAILLKEGPSGEAGYAKIGDISALNILISADPADATPTNPTIEIYRRPAGAFFDRFGRLLTDAGVDYVANTIEFDGDIVLAGGGANPVFGLAQPVAAPIWMAPFGVFGAQANGAALTPASFDWSVSPLLPDLHPEGATRDDISFMLFGDDLVPEPPAPESIPWLPYNEEIVEKLGLQLRPATRQELERWLDGAGIIDDVGSDLGAWRGKPARVAESRVSGRSAELAHQLYLDLFGRGGTNAEYLRGVLQQVVDQYVRSTGAQRVMGFELRRYVKNRPSSRFDAYRVLEDLDLLFALHRDLGLTPGEYRPIQQRWLEAIKPEGITVAQLAEAVRPSRYVRGSDVLDIFGE